MADDDAPEPLSTPRLDAIRAALPGDAPAGIDMKYESEFETLKAEVDALGAATGDVDFGAIVDLASQILTEKSKDLTVASYLVLGLTRTAGYTGIAEGLAATRAVVEGFWEDAFPPLRRMRGRQAALQFVAERTSTWIQSERATPDDRESLLHAEADTAALQAFVTEAMGEDAPAFSGLLREIREQLRRLPKPEPPKEETPEPDAPEPSPPSASADGPAPAAVAPSPVASSSPASGADATFSTAKEAGVVVMKVAQFFREADAFDAVAFGLVRALRWGAITAPPPTGKIPAPPAARRNALAGMLTAGNHAVLAREGEASFQQSPFHFWLDLQRLVASALKALGPPAAPAHAAVVDATAALVRRLPMLPTLTFQDKTPFADPLTAAWLDEIAAPAEGGGGASADSASAEAIQAAREQASGGDVPGAVAALMAGAGAPRDRFERGVAAAEMCLGAGRPDVALALLDDADDALRAHRLDVWDPVAAARALRLLYTCATALTGTAGSPQRKAALTERAGDAFGRLARLDPALAMRSTPPPAKG
ncbi:MAG: type VI secretion system protein TssA [Rhodothermaceae bacterium]|nr:type VI secretion system protein TssA [Rhodothermaceae bacterium]